MLRTEVLGRQGVDATHFRGMVYGKSKVGKKCVNCSANICNTTLLVSQRSMCLLYHRFRAGQIVT